MSAAGQQSASSSDSTVRAIQSALQPIEVMPAAAFGDRYVTDWPGDHHGQTLAVARPRTVHDVQRLVGYCADQNIPIIPQGGNTGLVSGAISDRPGRLLVSLERLNRIREIDAANHSLVAEAGCVLQTVKQVALEEDLLFPLSLGAEGSCQIGGNVATNAGGVNVLRYGMMRDLVLGLEAVLPDGSIWKGLSGLRKDNRGFDLKQLFIGSEGILGIITAASLKLFPKPETVETAYIGVNSFADATELFGQARRTCADLLSAFEVIGSECLPMAARIYPDMRNPLSTEAPVHILLEVSGAQTVELRYAVEQLLAEGIESGLVKDAVLAANIGQSQSFWQIREGLVEGQAQRGYHVRSDVSVTLPKIAPIIDHLRAMLAAEFPGWTGQAYGHVGDGNVHFNALPPSTLTEPQARATGQIIETRIFEIVEEFNGSISAEHGLGRTKSGRFTATVDPVHLSLMRSVKRAIDPQNIMNPGCMLAEETAI